MTKGQLSVGNTLTDYRGAVAFEILAMGIMVVATKNKLTVDGVWLSRQIKRQHLSPDGV